MLAEADAVLLIGDPALHICRQLPSGLTMYDLGTEWKELTGQAMVFAVWAVRRSFNKAHAELVRKVQDTLINSLSYSLEHIDQLAKDAARLSSFEAAFLHSYFTTLQFGFNAEHQKGLKEYYQQAQALGHISEIPDINFGEV